MTAKQLKEVTTYAKLYKLLITHVRIGYFNHVVTIGKKNYTDHKEAISRLENLYSRRQTA